MNHKILLKAGDFSFEIELFECKTTSEILKFLPIHSYANTWGKEIYFNIPVETGLESNAHEILEVGEIGFYPPMNTFCIFYGPTPASIGNEPHAADLVSVIGRISGDIENLFKIKKGDPISLKPFKNL